MTKIIFTIKESGHNLEYLHHIYEECLLNSNKYVFLVPERIRPNLGNFKWESNNRVVFDFIPSEIQRKCISSNILVNSYNISKLLKRKVKEYNADEIFAITIMALMPFAAIMIPSKISGIVYGIYLYNWKRMSYLRKIANVSRYLIFGNLKKFHKILILNDKSSSFYLNKLYKTDKFLFLPDPFVAINRNNIYKFREKYNIPHSTCLFVHFGAIEKRKGTLNILESIEYMPEEIKKKSYFVIAGKIKDDIRVDIYERVKKIVNPNLLIIDKFCTYDDLASMCQACNAILMPYLEYDKSSGLLGYASQFSKPVIGISNGLIGKLIKKYKLGLTCKSGDVDNLISNYQKIINGDIEKPTEIYCLDHSVNQFKDVIGTVL